MQRLIRIICCLVILPALQLKVHSQDSLNLFIDNELDSMEMLLKDFVQKEIRAVHYRMNTAFSLQERKIDSLFNVTYIQSENILGLDQENRELENQITSLKISAESYRKKSKKEQVRLKKLLFFSNTTILILVLAVSVLLFRMMRIQRLRSGTGLETLSRELRSDIRKTRKQLKRELKRDIKKLRRKK